MRDLYGHNGNFYICFLCFSMFYVFNMFSPGPATSWSRTVIGNSACLIVCLWMAVRVRTKNGLPDRKPTITKRNRGYCFGKAISGLRLEAWGNVICFIQSTGFGLQRLGTQGFIRMLKMAFSSSSTADLHIWISQLSWINLNSVFLQSCSTQSFLSELKLVWIYNTWLNGFLCYVQHLCKISGLTRINLNLAVPGPALHLAFLLFW